MNLMLISIVGALSAMGAPGQAPAKPPYQKAGVERENVSSQELNIRAYIELLRSDVRKSKAQVMGKIMQLDADQAAKFWPIYKAFETELTRVGDQVVALVRDYTASYDNLTSPVAEQLAAKLLNIEQQRHDLKKKYYLQMREQLDAVTAIRFLQVENQLERLIDLQIAAELPVVRQQ
jgi:hypothetical protein